MLSIRGEVYMRFNSKAAKRNGRRFVEDFVVDQTALVEKIAKRNVAPGRGPGPHPHRTEHEDTGRLMESITTDVEERGNKAVGVVGTNVDYGLYLEVGWHARSGKFYRYPWLWPAMFEAAKKMNDIARTHKRVFFRDDRGGEIKFPFSGYVPPEGRWDPGVMRFRWARGPKAGQFMSRAVWEALLAQFHARQGF